MPKGESEASPRVQWRQIKIVLWHAEAADGYASLEEDAVKHGKGRERPSQQAGVGLRESTCCGLGERRVRSTPAEQGTHSWQHESKRSAWGTDIERHLHHMHTHAASVMIHDSRMNDATGRR